MKCRHIKPAVKSLVCGDETHLTAIQDHLSRCSRCGERYGHILPLLNSVAAAGVLSVDEKRWAEFTAKLRHRVEQERPAPLGTWHSLWTWVAESNLMRFRKAIALSAVSVALLTALAGSLLQFGPENGEPERVVRPPEVKATVLPGLPPEMADVISIFGPDGFVTGVFSGFIQPGDFIAGHELGAEEIVETLDFLLS